MSPSQPDRDDVGRARELTRHQLGAALADKATDSFCLSYAGQAATGATFGLEALAMAAPAPWARAVIEFAPAQSPVVAIGAISAKAAEVVRRVVEEATENATPAEQAIAPLLQQVAIRQARERFYRDIGPLRDAIEHGAASVSPPRTQSARIGIAAAPVQACWLNRTVRAETPGSVLSDVASHDAIERIDVPRRLEPEAVDVTIASAASLRSARGLTGVGVAVGVIDSEVAINHPALQGRVVHRRNYTQEPWGVPASHGTAVAGIIAADDPGFTGMAPGAVINNYKVLATNSSLHAEDFEAALAIQHALEDGMRIVNCSWGAGPAGDGTSREARACDAAWALGLTIVKSAGNNGPGASTLTTPADADGVLVVGASSTDGTAVPSYSSRGPTADGRIRPHVLAPGGDFGATIDGILQGGGTGALSDVGTSFAAPHVAGLLALLLEQEPNLTPDEQRDRIVATCVALSGVAQDAQGNGLVEPTSI
jgi:serine protease AprX